MDGPLRPATKPKPNHQKDANQSRPSSQLAGSPPRSRDDLIQEYNKLADQYEAALILRQELQARLTPADQE
jgi:hypothetical protein